MERERELSGSIGPLSPSVVVRPGAERFIGQLCMGS